MNDAQKIAILEQALQMAASRFKGITNRLVGTRPKPHPNDLMWARDLAEEGLADVRADMLRALARDRVTAQEELMTTRSKLISRADMLRALARDRATAQHDILWHEVEMLALALREYARARD